MCLFMASIRQSFSIKPETALKLAALAKAQHRTASQQLDALVAFAYVDFYESLTDAQKLQFSKLTEGGSF